MFGMYFNKNPVSCYEEAATSDMGKFAKFHRGMLEQGIYLAPSGYEAGFTGLKHTEEDIDKTLDAARTVLKNI